MRGFAVILALIAQLVTQWAVAQQIPHLDLEMSGREYQAILKKQPRLFSLAPRDLDQIVAFGKRNLQWLDHINQFQQPKLSFSNKENMVGYPPDSPRVYNRQLVIDGYNALLTELPSEMRDVLVDQKPFTDQPPIETALYLKWALKADRAYQIAVRWMLLAPYLNELAGRRTADVRGYIFINQDPDSNKNLENFGNLNEKSKSDYYDWLIGVCFNTESSSTSCKRKLDTAIQSQSVLAFYNRYKDRAKQIYNSYFNIPRGSTYGSLQWKDGNMTAIAPFVDPKNQLYRDYLKGNIEDEWHWGDWQLEVNFDGDGVSPVQVYWQPGVTPHVPGLGVPEIYMDSNSLLTEWDVQWTIRHEFGHVLGFPDCYEEFYDRDQGVIISYQLDITNVMCSRRGVLQEKHYLELKRAYL